MKLQFSMFFVAFLSLASSQVMAQNCAGIIVEDKVIGSMHLLRSSPQTIVVRGTYTYSIDLRNDNAGIVARVYSKGGELFNQNDELIFIDVNNARHSYRFIQMGEMLRDGGAPVHQNTLRLDLAAIEWFANNQIATI